MHKTEVFGARVQKAPQLSRGETTERVGEGDHRLCNEFGDQFTRSATKLVDPREVGLGRVEATTFGTGLLHFPGGTGGVQ